MRITTKTGDKCETSLFGGRRVSKASVFIELVGELDELQAVVGWCGVAADSQRHGGRGLPATLRLSSALASDGVAGWEIASREVGDVQINRSEVWDIPKAADEKLSPGILLEKIVDDLYLMMSIVGFEMKCPGNIQLIGEEDVEFLEKEMAKYEEVVGDLSKFVRPGGSELSARLHIARTVCRRVERRMVGIIEKDTKERAGESMETNGVVGGHRNGVREERGAGGTKVKHVPGNVSIGQANPDVAKFMLKYLNRLSDLLFVMAYAN